MKICRVLVVDDHPILRNGLRHVIASNPEFEVVGEAGDGETALAMVSRLRPDILLLDINLPKKSGLEVARLVPLKCKSTRVIILTMYKTETVLNAAMESGAKGFVVKDNAITEIMTSLRVVASGGRYLSPGLCDGLHRPDGRKNAAAHETLARLTPMERRVLSLIAANKTSRQIAAELCLSYHTVETHRRNMCGKLNLHGSHPLLSFALMHSDAL